MRSVLRRSRWQLAAAWLLAASALAGGAVADVLDEILARGTVRIGVSQFAPWTIRDAGGELTGFEVEVANRLAADMGVDPELVTYEWEAIVPALRKGEIDVIAGGMAITPARALRVNFSVPYASSGTGLVTNTARTRNVESLEALNEPAIVIGTVAETLGAELAATLFDKAERQAFATPAEAEAAVKEGRVHAYVASMTEVRFLALEHPDVLDLPLDRPLLEAKAGLAVAKGEQEWLNFLNAWVTARRADKWLDSTHRYWFKSLDWRKRLVSPQ